MSGLAYSWRGDGIARITAAIDAIGPEKGRIVQMRAINRTGDRTFTETRRAVARQVGLPQGLTVSLGGLRKVKASASTLEYQIVSRGGFIPLRYFGPKQAAIGVSAAPWGRREVFYHTFGLREPALAATGHIFHRVGSKRFPIAKTFGPAVPRELVRDESRRAFFHTVESELPKRLAHEIRRATGGAFS